MVTTLLKRDGPAFRKNGWTVDELGHDRSGTTLWRVIHPEIVGNPSMQDQQDQSHAGNEVHAENEYEPSQDDQADNPRETRDSSAL